MQATVSNREFTTALSDPEKPAPEGIRGQDGKKSAKRFDIYRNNVVVGLIDALGDIFPAVARLVGEGFFRDMARLYIRANPPNSPLLFRYGRSMPDFLETFEPVAHLAYLPDVARIELAWLDAFHAADTSCFSAADLGAVPESELDDLRLTPHPATRIIRSRSAAVSIVSATRSGAGLADINPTAPEDGLVTRPVLDVQLRRLPPGAAVFLQSLVDGACLADAAEAAERDCAEFDLPLAIRAMLESGAFSQRGEEA
ncbi:DNA-binding domain-containing protein [Hoeflea sp. WL0058]|uniref:DNA-binding domain-containing protein n=1 Tax=Flavimaribacter sediminis TaxID=2865987 RepID=A0AAE3D323_9HYPH|nr:DNA-binding domain-containing protein [Flavimaribacter sediminis]MBW8639158.1 DNA-binding domain-containing protein [Flavimaribacter sediminis]